MLIIGHLIAARASVNHSNLSERFEASKLLPAMGADAGAQDATGKRALDLAEQQGAEEVVAVLTEY